MPDWQHHPGSLHIDPTAPDGPYLIYKTGIRFSGFFRLVDGDGTTVDIDTGAGQVSISTRSAAFLVTRIPGGDPNLVFDSDGEVVYTEVLP